MGEVIQQALNPDENSDDDPRKAQRRARERKEQLRREEDRKGAVEQALLPDTPSSMYSRAGWYDCPLSEKGHEEATEAGRLVAAEGFKFDVAFTSTLKRAIRTLDHALEETDHMWIPVTKARSPRFEVLRCLHFVDVTRI